MIPRFQLRVVSLGAACLIASGVLLGQDSNPTFKGTADLVVLHVNVQDARGGWIGGLGKSAFGVFENSRPQEVTFFATEDSPVTVGVLIDNSISMRTNRDLVVAAAKEFARVSHAEDELFAIAFNEFVAPVLPAHEPFTQDSVVFGRALDASISARGKTAFFDAMTMGLSYAAKGSHQRKVLVVISDGGDNASSGTFDEVLHAARAANVVIYGVGLVDPLDPDAKPERLRTLAQITGGELFMPKSQKDIAPMLTRIAADIRHTYTVGYVPATPPDGKFRNLRVVVTPPAGRRVVVRTRAGYTADAPPRPTEHDSDSR